MAVYIAYDGRAAYDEDEACIMEMIGECETDAEAISLFTAAWGDTDSVLFKYDDDGYDNLINGRRIYIDA